MSGEVGGGVEVKKEVQESPNCAGEISGWYGHWEGGRGRDKHVFLSNPLDLRSGDDIFAEEVVGLLHDGVEAEFEFAVFPSIGS